MQHEWIPSAFTPAAQRTPMQHAALKESDALVRELQAAEVLVIGMPMYNFGMPAPLKAWVDNIVRIGLTFDFDPAAKGRCVVGGRTPSVGVVTEKSSRAA